MNYQLMTGDCVEVMRSMPDNSADSIVTDPPYELGFMGKGWDKTGIANNVEMWREALRVLKPGGHLLAFSGSRTYHRMACAIEDAGFELRDQIMWLYGSGFPKSLDVSKAIDKAAGAKREMVGSKVGMPGYSLKANDTDEHGRTAYGKFSDAETECAITAPATDAARQWQGWGTALKPAHEPICVARKPLIGTVAANVLQHGVGALNIDACRVSTDEVLRAGAGGIPCRHDENVPRGRSGEASAQRRYTDAGGTDFAMKPGPRGGDPAGRWPANVIHDGSDEVIAAFPDAPGQQRAVGPEHGSKPSVNCYGDMGARPYTPPRVETEKNAARFFYCAKASRADRNDGCDELPDQKGGMNSNTSGQHITRRDGWRPDPVKNNHPTVKPTSLMTYLCRLVTPPGGVVLDPFMGSGSTGRGAILEGFSFIGIEMNADYATIAEARIRAAYMQARGLIADQQAVAA